jgi:hypothetical protein
VHVMLRELRRVEGDPPNKVNIELAVLDTGKVGGPVVVITIADSQDRVSVKTFSGYIRMIISRLRY